AIGSDHAVMPRLPDHMGRIDAASVDHPFRMVTAPARQFLNTTFTETPGSRKREVRPTALLHPKDAERLGVAEGGRVRLGNAQGELVVTAKLAEGQQEGVVVVESVWPNADFEGGVGINLLVSDDRGPPKGGAVFHDTAVWVRPAVEAVERLAAE
ncbi:MAG: molybdopterin dinucleotide binding domain-containing protein, partial [Roseococcus sp.]